MIVTIVEVSRSTIKDSIKRSIKALGDKCNLNFIDTELINDMMYMFYSSKFNKDISKWVTSSVEKRSIMFAKSPLENKPEFQPKFKKGIL